METVLITKTDYDKVVSLIKQGKVVAFPTDTVYGIGVLYNNEKAINAMKEAKQRDANKPFPLMVANYLQLLDVAYGIDKYTELVEKFMPGALTIIVKKKPCVPDYATNGKDTVAIRMPDDEYCLRLLNTVGPMLVTSANMSGESPANNEKEVFEALNGRISGVVEGKSGTSIPSTILDLTSDKPQIIRQGQITKEELEPYLKRGDK